MAICKSFYYNGNIVSLSGATTKLCSGNNCFSFFNNLIWYFPRLLNLLLVLSQIEFTWSWKLDCWSIWKSSSNQFSMWDFYEIFNQTGFTIPLFAKNQLIYIGVSFHVIALEPQKKFLSRPISVIPSLAQSLL